MLTWKNFLLQPLMLWIHSEDKYTWWPSSYPSSRLPWSVHQAQQRDVPMEEVCAALALSLLKGQLGVRGTTTMSELSRPMSVHLHFVSDRESWVGLDCSRTVCMVADHFRDRQNTPSENSLMCLHSNWRQRQFMEKKPSKFRGERQDIRKNRRSVEHTTWNSWRRGKKKN